MQGISRQPGVRQMRRHAMVLAGTALAVALALVFIGRASAQSGDWQLVRAEYGVRARSVDVTDIVRRLLWDYRETGRVAVTNQTMGGDPAVGADKTLRIIAENERHERQEFNYAEGSFIDVTLFSLRRDRDHDWHDGDRPRDNDRIRDRDGDGRRDDVSFRDRDDRDRDHDRDGRRDADDRARNLGDQRLQIVKGYWGAQGQMLNITDKLQAMVRNGVLQVHVDNIALGGDPAIGRDKVLIVLYTANGKEQAASTKEGNTMHIP